MSLTLTYDTQLSRVRAALTGLVDIGRYTLQRSPDQIRWTTVRGGELRSPSSGALTLDDYEFTADVPNFYRIRGPQVADDYARTVAAGGFGTTTSGTATTVVAGTTTGFSVSGGVGLIATTDINAVYLNGVSTGAPDQRLTTTIGLPVVPTGAAFTLRAAVRVTNSSNYYNASISVAVGGAATLQLTKNVANVGSVIASAVPVGTHAAGNRWTMVVEVSGSTVRARAWNANTSTDPGVWQVTAVDTSLTTGNLAAIGVRRETGNTDGVQTVTFDNTVVDEPRTTVFTGNITPTLDAVWLKSVARPFLNRTVDVRGYSEFSRTARAGVFPVVRRSLPIAVTDVRGSKRWTLLVNTHNAAEARELDLMLSAGDILFVHVPTTGRLSTVPGGYVTVGDTSEQVLPTHDLALRVFSLPCTAVAAPGPDVVGVTSTWQTVINSYATWADLVAAFATWADVLDTVGSPDDVVVE